MPQMRVLQGKSGYWTWKHGLNFKFFFKEKFVDELFDKLKKLIAEKLEVEESKITPEASFRQDLGADSLDTYELVYAIEEEMGVTIPDEKANEFETVGDAIDFLKTQDI